MTNTQCSGGVCELPPMYQAFSSSTDAAAATNGVGTAANTGGVVAAADYAPIDVNAWSCASDPPLVVTTAAAAAQHADAGGLSAVLATSAAAPGQSYCPECRCMLSTLVQGAATPPTQYVGAFWCGGRDKCAVTRLIPQCYRSPGLVRRAFAPTASHPPTCKSAWWARRASSFGGDARPVAACCWWRASAGRFSALSPPSFAGTRR